MAVVQGAVVLQIARMPRLEHVVWAQEEPKNNGYWFFVEPLIEESLTAANCAVKRARYAGRQAAASPATGLMKRHTAEQGALVADALGHNVREEIRRTRSEGSTTTATLDGVERSDRSLRSPVTTMSALANGPYTSAVSNRVTPSSTARRISAIASSCA